MTVSREDIEVSAEKMLMKLSAWVSREDVDVSAEKNGKRQVVIRSEELASSRIIWYDSRLRK